MKHSFVLLLVVICIGCQSDSSLPPLPPPTAPPTAVSVTRATTRDIVDYREFTGRTTAVDSVEVRARVSGYILQTPRANEEKGEEPKVEVSEGMRVKKGDLLFVIDSQPYELALQESTGALQAAEARLEQAKSDLSRSSQLLQSNATSRAEYDQAVAGVADLRGQIDTFKARSARNELDLDYTRVHAPIDGLLGQTLVTAGNLVVADQTILTTVVSVDPIYVDFDVDEQSVLDYRTRMIDGKVKNAREVQVTVNLGLANEEGFPHEGTIDFINNITDPGTGNTRVRATFENDSGILSPGLFARIQAPFTDNYAAVLVPTVSIGMDQQGHYVMVVGDDNHVSRRSIQPGPIKGDSTVIREGVTAGERVVTSGLQKIRTGDEVQTSETKADKPKVLSGDEPQPSERGMDAGDQE